LGIKTKKEEQEGGAESGENKEKEDITFAPEERDAKGFADKIKDYETLDPLRYQIEQKADRIVKEADINFSSEFLFLRLRSILITYLRSVRNQANTRRALTKEVASGGLSLDDSEADKILDIAKREKIDLEEEPYFHPEDIRYTEEYGGELAGYEAKVPASADKKDNSAAANKSGQGDESGKTAFQVQSEEQDSLQKKDIEKDKAEFAGKNKEEAIMQEDKQGSPGIDLGSIGEERDINYDLKAALGDKRKQKEEPPRTPDITTAKKEEKKEEKKQGFFARLFSKKTSREHVKEKDLTPDKKEKEEEGKISKTDSAKMKKKEEKKEEKSPRVKDEEVKEERKEKEKEVKKEEKTKEKPLGKKKRGAKTEGKKRVEDIRPAPRVMSPLDELRYMDIVTFRRLADDSNDRIEKIKKKIDLLGKESLGKMFDGIKAWRQSPVNRMYINIGQQSMSQGKDIKTITRERKESNQDYLTEAEFNAILELNKKLNFY
jgi:hypothetical protein